MTELETMTESVFRAVNAYVERRIGPLLAKVAELEQRVASIKDGKDGEKGEKGDPGQSVELLSLHQFTEKLVDDVVRKQVEVIPKAKDGERGADAVVDYDAIRVEIAKMIPAPIAGEKGQPGERGEDGKSAVIDYELLKTEIKAMIPEPIPGQRGEDGEKGERGEKGTDGVGVDVEVLESRIVTLVEEYVKEAVAEIPKPKDGEPGPQGQPGERGADGKSVDLESLGLQIESRVDAQVAKAVAEIPKPKDGEPGPRGEDGRSIHPDSLLPDIQIIVAKAVAEIPKPKDGKDGVDALPAKNGQDGISGQDGPPGRDALEIEPLSEIDFNRSYARRTYALHRGGLWVCRRSQPGVGSWECVVDGVDMEATGLQLSDDSRTLEFKFLASSGKEVVKAISFPVMINRGTWKPGEYKQGDVTTRHGSSWHAMRDTGAEPGLPSSEDDWRLIVKRGDRGKDADGVPKRVNNKVVRLK